MCLGICWCATHVETFEKPLFRWWFFLKWRKSDKKNCNRAVIIERLGELKRCPKLTAQHLTVCGRDKQCVLLACQLFTNSVSESISFVMPEEKDTAEIFQLVNNTFDIMNSRIPVGKWAIWSAFGLGMETQEEVFFADSTRTVKIWE